MYPNSRIKGIDINEEKLKMATKIKEKFGCKNLEFEKMDLSVDSTAEKFDLVLLLQVIEHIEDDRKTLIRIGEIMNSGGHLIITAPNSESKIINWSKKYVSVKGHFRDGYKVSELAKLLTDANFNIDEVRFLSGGIGQLVEKFETYLKIKLPSLLFGLVYPYLNCVAFLDDYLKANDRKHTSGILMVAVQS
jgi:SAM-dependent methyltransferase